MGPSKKPKALVTFGFKRHSTMWSSAVNVIKYYTINALASILFVQILTLVGALGLIYKSETVKL